MFGGFGVIVVVVVVVVVLCRGGCEIQQGRWLVKIMGGCNQRRGWIKLVAAGDWGGGGGYYITAVETKTCRSRGPEVDIG